MTNQKTVKPVDEQKPLSSRLLDCLMQVASIEGVLSSETAIASGLPLIEGDLTPELFVRAANRAGLAAILLDRELDIIPVEVLPAVLVLKDGGGAVLSDIDTELGYAVVTAPGDQSAHQISLQELQDAYTGHVFYLRKMQQFDSRTPRIHKDKSQHWFWSVIKSSRTIYRDVLIASFLINLFVLAQPLFVMNVYDRVVPNNALETLWALAIGVLIVYVFDFVLKVLRSYLIELAAKRTDVILSAQLFEKVLNLKMSARPVSTGAFASRLHDFDTIRNFITSSTILTLVDLPFLILFLAFIGYIGGWLVAVPLLIIPLAVFLAYRAQQKLRPSIENVMRGSAKKNATLVENLVSVEAVKVLGAESQVQKSWEQSVGYVAQWGLQSRVTSNATLTAIQFLQQLAMVFIVVFGVYLIADQELTVGGLIACVILNGRALASLGQIASLLVTYDHAEATLKSLDEIMNSPEEREAGKQYLHKPVIDGRLQFKGVTFSYPEQPVPALNSVSIDIQPGEKVAIIGKIGSGKSTLAKVLLRLYEPDNGSVMVDGFDLQQMDPADVRSNICYIAQDAQLFYGTVRENITLGLHGIEDREVIEAAGKAGVLDFVNSHPLGFNMPVGERGETLSGGQRSAINLSRAFLRSPSVIIMDEPTAAMDQSSEQHICRQIKQEFVDKTLILITHKMSMIDVVDRLIVMDKGTVVADGPKEQVLEHLRQGAVRGKN
ncbi:MAG: type I secretion system permease/ATPase [Pseudomonadales bacterium]|nr:type I secretion system permease/ATPase [Pseudomonadales bacterium]MCP5171688.1 type I secretion system permease/ATPase [Pseudomonadales bacterium]